tara:strand:- start:969 stop:1511 length:543 start_codon:yes stop_codon:yes gene_type:complete
MKEIKIIQTSPTRTASTVLLNLLHGFLIPNEEIHWSTETLIDKYLITKTHNIDVNSLENKYNKYQLYFVMSERNDDSVNKLIDNKYRTKTNVLIVNYTELNETESNTLDNIIDNMFNKFINFLPQEIIPKKNKNVFKEDMKKRIEKMNKIKEEIKDKPFSYWDKFTGIHGHHTNRNNYHV